MNRQIAAILSVLNLSTAIAAGSLSEPSNLACSRIIVTLYLLTNNLFVKRTTPFLVRQSVACYDFRSKGTDAAILGTCETHKISHKQLKPSSFLQLHTAILGGNATEITNSQNVGSTFQ